MGLKRGRVLKIWPKFLASLQGLGNLVLGPQGQNGLALCSSGQQGQTEQKMRSIFCEGPSEQRAAQPSADERSEAEAPKNYHLKKCMNMKLEHIGIAVKDLAASNELFASLLGRAHYKIEAVESEGVSTSFFMAGESKIELLEASRADSPIAKFIEKRGEGIHHLAFEVEDIEAEMKRLQAEGYRLLNETPKRGADNKLICFLHPKSSNGVLVELCQSIKD